MTERDVIKQTYRAMPHRQRIALVLVYYEGMTAAEVAAVFDDDTDADDVDALLADATALVVAALREHRFRGRELPGAA